MRSQDCTIVFISLCILGLHLSTPCEGRSIRKRTVSEVQLMHNMGQRKQMQERREWLQMRLRGIHTAPGRGSGEASRTRRRLLPEELPDLSDMTPEEIQYALNLLEKLLNSKQS